MHADLAKISIISAFTILSAACTSIEPPKHAPISTVQANPKTTLVTIALIMGEPNFSIDSGYQELEEGLYTRPELKPGKIMFAPIQDIVTYMGGEYDIDAKMKTASYRWLDKQIVLSAGSTMAQVNGIATAIELAPEWRGDSMWVSLPWVFEQLGAWVKWEESRQRFSATLILPVNKKTEGLAKGGNVTESTMTGQSMAFYGSADGRTLADVVLGYQNKDGGWPKLDRDINMLVPLNPAYFTGVKTKSTIDNDSTMKQIRVLARAYTAFHDSRYLDGFNRGMDYLFSAQLANGGWQQFWPAPLGYKKRITFNDDAIANVLEIMRDIDLGTPEFRFVDPTRIAKAKRAFDKGLAMILQTQLTVGGRKTGWCAQYDEITLAPTQGRAFELESVSGHESVNVVKFLMSLDKPPQAVVQAVQDAVAWLDAAKINGIRRVKQVDYTLENGFDTVIVKEAGAKPLWARFYHLGTGNPLFTSRDGIKRSEYSEVAYERRSKYNWFTEYPLELLEQDYPAWQTKWAPTQNVLAH